ncbi:MAG: P-II family nitrogen regulator [Kiritimatiellae bacterium]|nr:P-II family nitrogen regulator [Verrucomicrobiota bacterium]MBU4286059.1 P-II family nitrogen regulator [Verrucomicrobiota bacterium]MBU4366610.1 P-II family nitrogen regulator [Verrucomicrobiota bacterium]MCG2661394.1 P-II family nitrogen regulator [Kiritimatiellia bacterium]
MKLVTAYVQRFMAEKVTDALRVQKIHGVTVIQCQGFGRRIDGKTPHYEDPAAELGYAPKAKIEIVCRDKETQGIVQTIRNSAHTGRHGDGKIFVMDVTHAVDVRTGAEGEAIL